MAGLMVGFSTGTLDEMAPPGDESANRAVSLPKNPQSEPEDHEREQRVASIRVPVHPMSRQVA